MLHTLMGSNNYVTEVKYSQCALGIHCPASSVCCVIYTYCTCLLFWDAHENANDVPHGQCGGITHTEQKK